MMNSTNVLKIQKTMSELKYLIFFEIIYQTFIFAFDYQILLIFNNINLVVIMRNKGRFEYVDELRKIGTVQKMGQIESFYPPDFQDQKQQNTKFICYKQQIVLEQPPKKQQYLFTNKIINNYKEDIQPECHVLFKGNVDKISNDIDYYHNWSETLNQQIKQRNYDHKFFFQHAQPPPRLKVETKDKKGKQQDPTKNTRLKEDKEGTETTNEDNTSIELPQREKYNFNEITKHLYVNRYDKEDQENHLTDMTTKNQIAEFRKLKNLDQIQKIGSFQEEFTKFNYYIELPEEKFNISFVENSIVRGTNNLSIEYFRDIGAPSRDIGNFTIKNYNKMRSKQEEDQSFDIQNPANHQKRELLYLYFLKEDELKINKNQIIFPDVVNLSMGRITSANSHMCVRSEKVTKAQYLKLLKKMEKYDMRENEGGKPKQDKDVGTEDLEDLTMPLTGQKDNLPKQDNTNIQKIVEQINKIKKQLKSFQDRNKICNFKESLFNNQVYTKLQKLLNILYKQVTSKLPIRYPISEIGDHLYEIQGQDELGYDKMRLLWFIANCYDQMLNKQQKKVDLRNIADSKQSYQPTITKYKGPKIVAVESTQPKKIYGFNKLQKTPVKNRSISPLANTPSKTSRSQINKTPTKQNLTDRKTDRMSTTAKKFPITAKK